MFRWDMHAVLNAEERSKAILVLFIDVSGGQKALESKIRMFCGKAARFYSSHGGPGGPACNVLFSVS